MSFFPLISDFICFTRDSSCCSSSNRDLSALSTLTKEMETQFSNMRCKVKEGRCSLGSPTALLLINVPSERLKSTIRVEFPHELVRLRLHRGASHSLFAFLPRIFKFGNFHSRTRSINESYCLDQCLNWNANQTNE